MIIRNGTSYHDDTDLDAIRVLETARAARTRVRVHYGDTDTGRDWMDRYDVKGTIGRSTGRVKIPLLIANVRSRGGPGILDHCIVKITTTRKPKQVLFVHPSYHETIPVN